MDEQNLQLRSLEKRARKLERWLYLSICVWAITFGLIVVPERVWQSQAQQAAAPSSLRVSELVVVDPKGVERVRLGGDLPDAVIEGKRVARGEKIAGMLLYDGTGQERGGYVTFEPSGNIGLTLDTRRKQAAFFVAGPDGGAALQLWNDKDSIELRSDKDGSRLTAVRDGRIASQQPQINVIAPEVCRIYQSARPKMTNEQVLQECRKRFSEMACLSCLGK